MDKDVAAGVIAGLFGVLGLRGRRVGDAQRQEVLAVGVAAVDVIQPLRRLAVARDMLLPYRLIPKMDLVFLQRDIARSEERRVGKKCRSRLSPSHY